MKISRPSPSMVVAGIALFVSLGGTSIAAVNYAARAGAVDGKSAVHAGASLSNAAGKLVATNRSGTDKGRLPGKFVADVARTSVFSRTIDVADNSAGAPQTLVTMRGLGTLTATCNDQSAAPGVEDPVTILTFLNTSGEAIHVARRSGNSDGAITVAPNQTATAINIGNVNTYMFQIERRTHNAMINGGARQQLQGTPSASCVVFGTVIQALP